MLLQIAGKHPVIGALNKETPLIGVISEYCVLRHFVAALPDGWHQDGEEAEQEVETGQHGQAEHPEPEQQVHLAYSHLCIIYPSI